MLTEAIFVRDELHLTPLVFALRFAVVPLMSVIELWDIPVDEPDNTVNLQLADSEFSEAVIVVVPAAFAVTIPFWSIAATLVLELVHFGAEAPS